MIPTRRNTARYKLALAIFQTLADAVPVLEIQGDNLDEYALNDILNLTLNDVTIGYRVIERSPRFMVLQLIGA